MNKNMQVSAFYEAHFHLLKVKMHKIITLIKSMFVDTAYITLYLSWLIYMMKGQN